MRLCEARGWYEPDKSIESRIYCFGDEGGQGDASDVEAGRQGMGPAASGPQKSLGAKSDVADYSKDDSDRRVQSTGSTTNVNIDRSQPSVSTDRGRVYGTQANLDKAVERGDINITPSQLILILLGHLKRGPLLHLLAVFCRKIVQGSLLLVQDCLIQIFFTNKYHW